ncbi:MAG: zf-HC2 domain-containing protein [Candidatus Omnitrophota bacterium]
MQRICPSEIRLSQYLSNMLDLRDTDQVEKHLVHCSSCRKLLAETSYITHSFDLREKAGVFLRITIKKIWVFICLLAFICSFLFPRYFIQTLTICLLSGFKSITDAHTTKTLVLVYEAWRSGNKKTMDKLLSRFNKKKGD